MKKNFYFGFLTWLFSIAIIYFFIFLFFFTNLDKYIYGYTLSDISSLNFYTKNSKIVNHLRNPEFNYSKNLEDYIFTRFTNNSKKEMVLLQGDSWFNDIEKFKSSAQSLKMLGKDFNIINAGTVSYSPSLMSVQLKLLKESFNIDPKYLITYIDQTDIGDENCRYKNLKKYDVRNNLIAIPFEEYPYSGKILNIDQMLKFSQIKLNNHNNISRTFSVINYKLKKGLVKLKQNYLKKIKDYPYSGACHIEDILRPLINENPEEIIYFKKSLKEYFDRINSNKKIKKTFVVTHPHKAHLVDKKYNVNVADIVDEVINNYPNFYHINFSKKIKNNNLYNKLENIWAEDEIHLNEKNHSEIFLPEIIKDFLSLKNN